MTFIKPHLSSHAGSVPTTFNLIQAATTAFNATRSRNQQKKKLRHFSSNVVFCTSHEKLNPFPLIVNQQLPKGLLTSSTILREWEHLIAFTFYFQLFKRDKNGEGKSLVKVSVCQCPFFLQAG